jgi:protein-disulfide isomerase-like protein with CxxC motif
MGLFKQMKQMKEAVAEAPDLVRSSMEMQQAMQAAPPPGAAVGSAPSAAGETALDDETISNVSLARYAEICRVATERGITDLAGVAAVAAEHGVATADWNTAMNGWNARFASDTAAAMRFNALWRGIG